MTNIDKVILQMMQVMLQNKLPAIDRIEEESHDPFKVLVGTLLSARTKDETTDAVCRRLFKRVSSYHDLKHLSLIELEELIKPIGFYHTKARHLQRLPHVLEERFAGIIPRTIEELILLPGVGRKTANLVLVIAFKIPAVCVDTHVHRIMNRLGYVSTKTSLETEMALRGKLPVKHWLVFNSCFVSYGQHVCLPRNPRCNECRIFSECERVGVNR
ncbi:MAG: endonuclease III [Candidatus Cloacimonetes bacterium]|nr:endonuclease III [Candidatus Cloacimonadota bacterium]